MERQPSSRTCFGCGLENEMGLKSVWYSDFEKNQIISQVEIAEYFHGYPGISHGGIVAALLDETSFRAIILEEKDRFLVDRLFVTGNMKITYLQPTPTCQPLTVVGWINEKSSKKYVTAAEIRKADGTVTASCTATIVQPPDGFDKKFGISPGQEF